ncbi:MAG: type IV pilin protein [Desulfurivibrionaceae bacterium]
MGKSSYQNVGKNKKGFTLVELMVVVAIVGILASVAVTQFTKYRGRAHDSVALSDIRNTRTAVEGFMSEWQHYPY